MHRNWRKSLSAAESFLPALIKDLHLKHPTGPEIMFKDLKGHKDPIEGVQLEIFCQMFTSEHLTQCHTQSTFTEQGF